MATVKTAISLEGSLFERAEALARKMKISRSRLFALALEEFLRQHQNQQLLEQLNAAYNDAPDPEEEALLHAARQSYRRLADNKW